MSFRHVTLALDLALTSPGFAVLAVTGEREPILLETTSVTTTAKESHGYRLCQIGDEIKRLLETYKPEYIVRERGFSRHARTTQAIFKVVGISDFVTFYYDPSIDIQEVAATTVKKTVAGKGNASKDEVADAVFRILQIENKDDFYTARGRLLDDKTDACAVGLTYLSEKGLIKV